MYILTASMSLTGNKLIIHDPSTTGPGNKNGVVELELPAPCLATHWGFPTASRLRSLSAGIHCTAATLLVAGVVTIGSVANSTIDDNVKTGVCAVTGFLMLSACCCCKLSNDYWQLSADIRQYTDRSFKGYRWWDNRVPSAAANDEIV